MGKPLPNGCGSGRGGAGRGFDRGVREVMNRMVFELQDVPTLVDIFVTHNWLNYFETVS